MLDPETPLDRWQGEPLATEPALTPFDRIDAPSAEDARAPDWLDRLGAWVDSPVMDVLLVVLIALVAAVLVGVAVL